MNRPWKVWLWFLLALAIVVPAMGWLTHKAMELDRAVTASARTADLEEDISLALWRMDVALAPLVAQEAARPYVVYRPFLVAPNSPGTKGTVQPQASPLLVQPSEFVRLHFELNEDGELSSPQCPAGTLQELAVHNGAPRDNIALSCDSLNQLGEKLEHKALAQQLPRQTLPPVEVTEYAWNNRWNTNNLTVADDSSELNQQVLVQNDGPLQQAALPRTASQPLPAAGQQISEEQIPGQPVAENSFDAPQQPTPQPQSEAPNPQMADPQMAGPGPQERSPQQPPPAQADEGSQQHSTWKEQYSGAFYGYGRAPRAQVQRGQLEFQRRNKALQSYANAEVVRQRKQLPLSLPKQEVQEGVSAPLWVDGELILARRVKIDDREAIQGCWFDWEKLKDFLIAEGAGASGAGVSGAAAALPEFDLQPIAGDRPVAPARRLATVPVEIVVPTPTFTPSALSPIRLSLWIAWACLIFATGAVALLLQGVITLSERRAAFVSAVTHELRTPLTTFRMYAEMLSGGMIRDREQQQQYTETLRVEADRLSHLVENVLSYARLERGRRGGRREDIAVRDLLQRVGSRLEERALQAEMRLHVEVPEDVRDVVLHTDPQAVEQILFNLVDNACKYARSAEDRTIRVRASRSHSGVALQVSDRGPGISAQFARKLFQPFSKSAEDAAVSAPGVGLGLALCRRLAREIGGHLALESSEGGACFRLGLPLARR